ncbi:NADPH-dependent FMN reductase [Streptomyces sp. NPDC004609]|uniref:NADPH-dependent FMN reductase n=1 Tax=Streptomyces sp. NPDC004609 TaxID=3364704 RepID=UPI00367C8620
MPERSLRVAVVDGSIRTGRSGPTPARWIAAEAAGREDLEVDVVDLAEARLPDAPPENGTVPVPRAVRDLARRLARSDAFVIVTPEDTHGFPASLGNAIGWYTDAWKAKPVALVGYGGPGGGLRAVARLREILPGKHAVTVRESVVFPGHAEEFDGEGRPGDPEGGTAAAGAMLDQLTWWGHTLRDAREQRPYRG